MRPICSLCHVEMRCHKNGRHVEIISGGMPYQLWSGDEWKCPHCGAGVICNYGREPVAEAHEGARYRTIRDYEAGAENLVVIEG